jgi:hypothetical protein
MGKLPRPRFVKAFTVGVDTAAFQVTGEPEMVVRLGTRAA